MANKIKPEELENIQNAVRLLNQVKAVIADLEVNKAKAMQEAFAAEQSLQQLQAKLQEDYGSITIDLNTGEYQEEVEEAEEVTTK